MSNWPTKKLGEICEFQNGIWKGKKPPFKKISVIRNVNFLNRGLIDFDNLEEIEVEERFYKTHLLQKGDLILERSGGGPEQPVGRVAYFEKEGEYTFSNFTTRIRVKNLKEIDPKYLWAYLHFLYKLGITKSLQSQTTGIRNLDFKAYQNLQIPLPPLPIQQKIVSVLDTIQSAIEVQEEIIEKTKELKKSMMAEIFNSKFKNQKSKLQFKIQKWVKLETICRPRKEQVLPRVDDKYIGLEHLDSGEIAIKRFGNGCEVRSSKNKFYPGDILYGKLRPYLDKAALINFEGISSTDLLVLVCDKKEILPEYLIHILHLPEFVNFAISTTTGTNHPRTSWEALKTFKVPLISLPEQHEIAEILQTIDQKIEIEKKKKALYEDLFKTMLNKIMNQEIDVEKLNL